MSFFAKLDAANCNGQDATRFFSCPFSEVPSRGPHCICIPGRSLTNTCAWTKQKAKFECHLSVIGLEMPWKRHVHCALYKCKDRCSTRMVWKRSAPFLSVVLMPKEGEHVKKFVIKVIQQNSIRILRLQRTFHQISQKTAVKNQVVNRHTFQGSFKR